MMNSILILFSKRLDKSGRRIQYKTGRDLNMRMGELHPHLMYQTSDVGKAYRVYKLAIALCEGIDQGRQEAQQ